MADDELPEPEKAQDVRRRRVKELRDKGCTVAQIAERLGTTTRTVERALAYVRKVNGGGEG